MSAAGRADPDNRINPYRPHDRPLLGRESLAAHTEWARAVVASAKADETGRAYVNFLDDTADAEATYGEETYRRLVALKDEYDPTNVFHLNQNIVPSV